MKNLFPFVALLALAAVPPPPNVAFNWQYQTTPSNTTFRVYGTTNLSQNITNWPQLAAWTNYASFTNGGQVTYSNSLFLAPSAYYFTMTASNTFWGESPFSAPVSTPPPASTPIGVGLQYLGP